MKKFLFITSLLLASTLAWSQKPTDDFTGKWRAKDGDILTIKKEAGYFVGYDEKGNKVVYDVKFEDDEWIGRGRDPFTGISAKCEVMFEGEKLKLRGGIGFIKTSHYFTRL